MKLTDSACKNAKPAEKSRKMADGEGLYLEIMPNGSKYWRLKYRIRGKEKRLALGVYPEVTLAEARQKKIDARKLIKDSIDPAQKKKEDKLNDELNAGNTFEVIAREWHKVKQDGWTKNYAGDVLRRLEMDIFPLLGSMQSHFYIVVWDLNP